MSIERVALISDVHGNMPALEAVLADVDRRAIARVFCLGDLIGKGPHPSRAVDICRARCERVVRGNWDEGVAAATDDDPLAGWQRQRLGAERLAYLAALPNTAELVLAGRRIRLLHASARGVHHRVHQNDPVETLLAMFENTDFTGGGLAPDVVACGDIHQAYLRTFHDHDKVLVNAGSVGNPLDLPLACYAVVEGAGADDATRVLSVTLVRLAYDVQRAIREASAEGMPYLGQYAEELRTARFQRR